MSFPRRRENESAEEEDADNMRRMGMTDELVIGILIITIIWGFFMISFMSYYIFKNWRYILNKR